MFKRYGWVSVCSVFLWGVPAQSVLNEGLNDEAYRQCQHLCGVMQECARKRYSAVPRDMWKTYGVILNTALIDIQGTCMAGCHLARVDPGAIEEAAEDEDVAEDA